MSIPKVFVSYSHDSPEHKKWVLDLATRLRSSGVDSLIDQWDLKPGDDLAHFMETNLTSADRVLMVCTDRYVEKANAGIGGVGYEKMIVTADSLARIDSNKVIPIIRQAGSVSVPTFLRTKLFLDFSRPDQFEFAFDELIRTLHNAPLFIKPPISQSPFPEKPKDARPRNDGLRELMKAVISEFESTTDFHLSYRDLVSQMQVSRVMVDLLFKEGLQQGLLLRHTHDYYSLTDKGKIYAVENDLLN